MQLKFCLRTVWCRHTFWREEVEWEISTGTRPEVKNCFQRSSVPSWLTFPLAEKRVASSTNDSDDSGSRSEPLASVRVFLLHDVLFSRSQRALAHTRQETPKICLNRSPVQKLPSNYTPYVRSLQSWRKKCKRRRKFDKKLRRRYRGWRRF